jgi:hypothetical protein
MPKFRKRPDEVEARQFLGGPEEAGPIIGWVLMHDGAARYHEERREGIAPHRPDDINEIIEPEHISIDTLSGTQWVTPGDWVVRGTMGDFYPCKPGIFASTFDPIE